MDLKAKYQEEIVKKYGFLSYEQSEHFEAGILSVFKVCSVSDKREALDSISFGDIWRL